MLPNGDARTKVCLSISQVLASPKKSPVKDRIWRFSEGWVRRAFQDSVKSTHFSEREELQGM